MDPGPESEDLYQPEPELAPILPMLPWRVPTAPPLSTMAQSDTSDTGRSFSMPTDGLSSTNFSQRHEAATPEAQMIYPASHNRGVRSFLRNYEFSWKDSRLLFASEPFDVDQAVETPSCAANPNSETASTTTPVANPRVQSSSSRGHEFQHLFGADLLGIGGLAASWAASGVGGNLQTTSATYAVSSTSSESQSTAGTDPDTQTPRPPQAVIAYGRAIDEMVELFLDHYLRSYAPQRSQKRNSAARNDQDASLGGRDSARRTNRNGKSTSRTSGSSKRKPIGGSGESEDEDSHGKGQNSSATARFANSPYLACPFLKFKPKSYLKACGVKLTTISHVKDHLKGKHYKQYCTKCYKTFEKDNTTDHGCIPKPTAPVELITNQKLQAIERRVDRTKSLREKWQSIYKVLFPDEPLCLDPFLDLIRSEKIKEIEDYLRSRGTLDLLQAVLEGSEFRGENAAKICRLFREEFFPRLLSLECAFDGEMDSLSNVSRKLAEDDNQTAELAHPDRTLDPDPDGIHAFVSRFTQSHGLQHSPDSTEIIQTYPFMDLNGHSTAFDGQPSIDVDDRQRPNTVEIADPELTGPESNMWNIPIGSGEHPTDAELSCLLFTEDEAFGPRDVDGFMSWNMRRQYKVLTYFGSVIV